MAYEENNGEKLIKFALAQAGNRSNTLTMTHTQYPAHWFYGYNCGFNENFP
jgi:hypothetical protein